MEELQSSQRLILEMREALKDALHLLLILDSEGACQAHQKLTDKTMVTIRETLN